MSRHEYPGSIGSYIIGFGLSLLLTAGTFGLVIFDLLQGTELVATVITLAVVQLVVQLVFFLHLGKEARPKWNLFMFVFMMLILVTIVFGSLWIMNNLNYHGMNHDDMNAYMQREAQKGF